MLSLGLSVWQRRGASGGNIAPAVAVTSPIAGATLIEGLAANLAGTATDADGSISSVTPKLDGVGLGSATIGAGTWSYSYAPAAADIGSRTITATATDSSGDSVTSSDVSVTIQSAEAGIVAACAPDILLVAGIRGTTYLTGNPITAWDDATANNRDGSATDGPATYTASGQTFADFENTVDSNGQRITIPHAWLSGATKFSIAFVVQRTKLAQTTLLFSCDSFDIAARFYTDGGNSIRFHPTAATPYGYCALDANLNLIEWDFDGTQATNATKMQIYINGVAQGLTFSGSLGTAVPALLAGSIGRQSNDTGACQARLGMFLGKAGSVLDSTAKTALRARAKTLFPSLPY